MSSQSERHVPARRSAAEIEDVEEDAARARRRAGAVAIIGMDCNFPGAPSPEALWDLLVSGRDAIRDIPGDRWTVDAVPQKGGYIDDIDKFDPSFFGISHREAKFIDPQQRLLLECSYRALEHAGVPASALAGSDTGVFFGISSVDYSMLTSVDPDVVNQYSGTGNTHCVAANRVSYTLDLKGPSVALDAACASALVAVHHAVRSLRLGESGLALAGGVNCILTPHLTINFHQANMLSPDARCNTFDARANGYVRSEGAGVVVLKRLADAVADNDRILAVIHGSAVTQNGRSNGITAPSQVMQASAVRKALRDAGARPPQVSYVEAHGTATPLGDMMELSALLEAYGDRGRDNPLIVGSVKTNLGHMEAASGMGGLLKVVLSLQHRWIPAHLNFETLNPAIPVGDVPLVIPRTGMPWRGPDGDRLAGVSSFGFGGANAHLVVGEAPLSPAAAAETEPRTHVLVLSARSQAALDAHASNVASWLQATPCDASEICNTLDLGRNHYPWRMAVLGATTEEAPRGAPRAAGPGDGARRRAARAARRRIAMLFSGQGTLYPGMGRRLYETRARFRETLDRCARVLRDDTGLDLLSFLFAADEEPARDALRDTRVAQPALYSVQAALADLWRSWGVVPDFVAGHSVGAFAAAYAAGALDLEEGVRLTARRGRLIGELAEGAMTAVRLGEPEVRRLLREAGLPLDVAAVNSPDETVVSGSGPDMERFEQVLAGKGIRGKPLQVSHAFHSRMMDPMLAALAETPVSFRDPAVPMVSDTTGRLVQPGELAAAGYWRRHARDAVRFMATMSTLGDLGVRTFVEVGPGAQLLALGRRAFPAADATWLPSMRKGQEEVRVLRSLATLYCEGADVRWTEVEGPRRPPVPLPRYPFERSRHWAPTISPFADRGAVDTHRYEIGVTTHPYLEEHKAWGELLVPGAFSLAKVMTVVSSQARGGAIVLEEVTLHRPLLLNGSHPLRLSLSFERDGGRRTFALRGDDSEGTTYLTGAWRSEEDAGARLDGIFSPLEDSRSWPGVTSGPELYRLLNRTGLELGPALMWAEEIRSRDDQLLARVRAPESGGPWHDMVIPVGQLDTLVQLMGMLVGREEVGTLLPYSFERIRFLRSPSGGLWCQGRRRAGTRDMVTGDLRLVDDQGRAIVEVEGLCVRRTTREVLLRGFQNRVGDWLYHLRYREQPAAAAGARPAGRLLVVGGTDAQAGALGRELGDGSTVRVPLADGYDPALFDRLLAEAFAGGKIPCAGVVFFPPDGGDVAETAERNTRSLMGLARSLARWPGGQPPRLVIVTRGGQAVPSDGVTARPQDWAMWGLGAVIAREIPRLGTVLVDVDEPEPAVLARRLLGELASVGEPHVAWRGDVRRVARLEARASVPQGALEIPPDRTFLVTGGMGALGLRCADWLAYQGARHLALLGRSAPSPAARRRIDALTAQGVEVHICIADVADRASLRAALERLRLAGPPLAGVLHTAGVLHDGALSALEREDVARVLAPKVAGTWNLVEETERLSPDFLVLFSSAAGVLGPPGQGAYAAANAFMDGVAHHLRARGRRAYSVDWGPWAGGGMATRTAAMGRTAWSALGMIDISPAQGMEALRRVLLGDEPQVLVLPIARGPLARAFAGDRLSALVSELAAPGSGADTGPTEAPGAALLRTLNEAPEEERREQVERFVQETIGRVLGRADGTVVHPAENLADIGMDSLMALELNEKIGSAFGRPLPQELLLGSPSVRSIVEHLVVLDPAEGTAPLAALRNAPVEAPKPARRRPTVDERFAPKLDPILSELEAARGSGMYCFEKAVTGLDKQYVECADGQRRLMFATYNYLGLLGDPRIEAAAVEAIRRYGTGTHGARLIAGTLDLHLALERKLADLHRREAAILFSSGFMANYSTVPALVGPGDFVISDQLNHASLVDGCRASGATFRVFRHNDMADLERVLSEVPDDRRALVVADAIFSLDGDIFDLPMAVPLCREHGAMLMVDEAHSLGVLGANGHGIEEHFDMVGTVDVLMGTLSKCVPASGGYIAGSARLVEYVRHAARGYIFSGATAPGSVAAALAGLEILEREGAHLRERLHANASWFLERLRAAGLDTGRSCTPIIPVIVGSRENALALTHYCQQNGLYAVPAIPPGVAPGTSRLRLNVTAALSHADIQAALDIIFAGARAVLGMSIPHDPHDSLVLR